MGMGKPGCKWRAPRADGEPRVQMGSPIGGWRTPYGAGEPQIWTETPVCGYGEPQQQAHRSGRARKVRTGLLCVALFISSRGARDRKEEGMRGAQSEGGSATSAPGAGLRLRCRPCPGLGGLRGSRGHGSLRVGARARFPGGEDPVCSLLPCPVRFLPSGPSGRRPCSQLTVTGKALAKRRGVCSPCCRRKKSAPSPRPLLLLPATPGTAWGVPAQKRGKIQPRAEPSPISLCPANHRVLGTRCPRALFPLPQALQPCPGLLRGLRAAPAAPRARLAGAEPPGACAAPCRSAAAAPCSRCWRLTTSWSPRSPCCRPCGGGRRG